MYHVQYTSELWKYFYRLLAFCRIQVTFWNIKFSISNDIFAKSNVDFSHANFQRAVVFRNIINADQLTKLSFKCANFGRTLELSSKKLLSSTADLKRTKAD
jgi:hypothetical protein